MVAPVPDTRQQPEPIQTTQQIRPRVSYNSAGLERILATLGVSYRWNLRARRIEYWRPQQQRWAEVTDRNEAKIRASIARRFTQKHRTDRLVDWDPPTTKWELWRNALMQDAEVDPFICDFLDQLPEWDGTDRAEHQIPMLWPDTADTAMTRWASRYPLLAAIQLAYEPGAKIDEHPVIVGPQGCGKSTWLATLLGPGRSEWFSDSLTLDGSAKEKAEALQGRVIVELSEMTGRGKADIDKLKAFMTRTDDGQHRAAYARNPETSLRRCAIIGTANDQGTGVLPDDPTGNRRFVVIPVAAAAGPIEPAIATIRDQLWAETLHKHTEGVWGTASLPRTLHTTRDTTNANYEYKDPLDERIAQLTEPGTPHDIAFKIGLTQADDPMTPSQSTRLGRRLTAAKWTRTRTRINGKKSVYWHPPANTQVNLDI